MNRPVLHPHPLGENCLWFSKPAPKIYQESIKQIYRQLLSVKTEVLLVMTSERGFRELCIQPLQLVVVKWDLGIQSFTPAHNDAG